MLGCINPGFDAKMDWPNIVDIKETQSTAKEAPPNPFVKTASGIRNSRDVLWIPSTSSLLKLRIIIAARTGHGGHRSAAVTTETVKGHFFWQKMDDDIKSFVQTRLHCLCTQPGTTIRLPLGHALHADLPNELLYFDFCYMYTSEGDSLYVLILKDDHSGFVWLVPTTETTAEITADSLIKWFSAFGVVTQWVSDRGSHFKNEVVRLLQEKTKSSHHFTLSHCHWSNGTVEVICRELFRACRALMFEYQLTQICWPSIMPVVQSALNNSLLDRLGNRCPLTVFTGHKQDTPLATDTRTVARKTQVLSIDDIKLAHLNSIRVLQDALQDMHKDVAHRSSKNDGKRLTHIIARLEYVPSISRKEMSYCVVYYSVNDHENHQ